jgi:hypothetical protein
MQSEEMVRQVRCEVFFPRLIRGRSTSRRILGRRVRMIDPDPLGREAGQTARDHQSRLLLLLCRLLT